MGKITTVEFVCNHCDTVEKSVLVGDMESVIDRPRHWASIRRGTGGTEELVCPAHEVQVHTANVVVSG